MKPSYLSQVLSGLLIFFALIQLYKDNAPITPFNSVVLLLLFSIAIAVHGIMHFMAEVKYDFNPLENKRWIY